MPTFWAPIARLGRGARAFAVGLVCDARDLPMELVRRVLAARLTWTFVAMNVGVHVIAKSIGGDDALETLGNVSGFSVADVSRGEWWRLVTFAWVHNDDSHLYANMQCLAVYGLLLEPIVGSRWFAFIYGCSMAGSSAIDLGFAGNDTVGSSGAIFGVIGAMLVLPASSRRWHSRLVWLWTFHFVLTSFDSARENPLVGHPAHASGLVAGMLAATLVEAYGAGAVLLRSRRRTLAAAAGILLVASCELADTRWMPNWFAMRARTAQALDDSTAAFAQWQRVVALADPSRPVEAWLISDAADFDFNSGNVARARTLYQRIAPSLNDTHVYTWLGRMHARVTPRNEYVAEVYFLEALKVNPDSPEALNALALLYLSSKDSTLFMPDSALVLTRKAILLDEVRSAAFVRTCAFAHFYCDEDASAVELMRLAIRLGPEDRERYEADLAKMLKWIEVEGAAGTDLTDGMAAD